jgi:hypothetical protein
MTQRITEKDLQGRIDWLNKLTNNPPDPYTTQKDLHVTPNPGNYHLDSAYGGHGLAQMSEGGGVRKVIGGFYPKKELMALLNAYIDGIQEGIRKHEVH